jgi:hypothetical protein
MTRILLSCRIRKPFVLKIYHLMMALLATYWFAYLINSLLTS